MAHINFVIPHKLSELNEDALDNQYYVRNIVTPKGIITKLRDAKQCLKDEGSEFILENFPTYYSVLHYKKEIQNDIMVMAYNDLHSASSQLHKTISSLRNKESLSEEVKQKYVTITKMLLYIYVTSGITIEEMLAAKQEQMLPKKGKGKQKKADWNQEGYNKQKMLQLLNGILQEEIELFWNPPVAEEVFVNMVASICYTFLESPSIKSEKDLTIEVFTMLGTLLKRHNHREAFIWRLIGMVKIHEHLVTVIPDGLKILMEEHNSDSLLNDFIVKMMEWQCDQMQIDTQGTKNCCGVLTGIATLMPGHMLSKVSFLTQFLEHDLYTIRNSIIDVITEVVRTVLARDDLTVQQKVVRDQYILLLKDHTFDVNSYVRSHVFAQLTRLQKDNTIPIRLQVDILKCGVRNLEDEASTARKSAAKLVTAFLTHNVFGAQLKMGETKILLDTEKSRLEGLRIKCGLNEKVKQLEEEWQKIEKDVKIVISNNIDADFDEDMEASQKDHSELVQLYIKDGKYKEAFQICHMIAQSLDDFQKKAEEMNDEQLVGLYTALIKEIFLSIDSHQRKQTIDEQDLLDLENCENKVTLLDTKMQFLEMMTPAIDKMMLLLDSVTVADMHEAVEFFVTAQKFDVDNAVLGVLEMLNLVTFIEQERQDIITEAFRTLYLKTDAETTDAHKRIVIDRLIELLKHANALQREAISKIVSDWVVKGYLDNSIIDMLWNYFLKKVDVTADKCLGAIELLGMASLGRPSIISNNKKLVASIAFGNDRRRDPVVFIVVCRVLQNKSGKKTSRIANDDEMWTDITNILVEQFADYTPYYNTMINEAITLIFELCSKPYKHVNELLLRILTVYRKLSDGGRVKKFALNQLVFLFGILATKQLVFLDRTVYGELRRRRDVTDQKKQLKTRHSKHFDSASAARRTGISSVVEESTTVEDETLEGAQAEDTEAEFILHVLENDVVNGSGSLAQLSKFIKTICEKPSLCNDDEVYETAILALLRCMLVSSKFCEENLRLVFTILERTKNPALKCTIIIQSSDMLVRFPNLLDDWMPRIFAQLKETNFKVRFETFVVLKNLILGDMIRVQGSIAEMVRCMVDPKQELQDLATVFLKSLAQKANILYNMIPDIFSHLADESILGEEQLRFVMKFLFGLVTKRNHFDNLIDRFCSKFRITEDDYKCRNIAYCLSLVQMNENSLQHLSENFLDYKDSMHNDNVYAIFMQMLGPHLRSTKPQIKDLAKEIEDKIKGVFEVDKDGNKVSNDKHTFRKPAPPKSAKKGVRGKRARKKIRAQSYSDSSSDSD